MIARLGAAALICILAGSAALAAGPISLEPFEAGHLQRTLAENKGRVVLIDFWATWCAPCLAEIPVLVKLETRLREKGFRLVTVSADEGEDRRRALEFLQEQSVPPPAYIKSADDDDAFINAIHPKWSGALPALFLYGRDGKLAKMWIGETDLEEIEKAVAALL